jgi:hypothetical protein
MPIPEDILNGMKCCFLNDGHIAFEPILVTCGAVGCKQCLSRLNIEEYDCYSCKGKHRRPDLKNAPVIKPVEDLFKSHFSDLFEYVKENIEKIASLPKSKIEKNIQINSLLL